MLDHETPRIDKYSVLDGESSEELAAKVTRSLANRWITLGGIAVLPATADAPAMYLQAVGRLK